MAPDKDTGFDGPGAPEFPVPSRSSNPGTTQLLWVATDLAAAHPDWTVRQVVDQAEQLINECRARTKP